MRPRRRRLRPLDAALPLPQTESQRPQRRNEGKDAPMATKTLGLVKSNVVVADIVDMSFTKAAAAELGPYKGRSR